MKKLLFFTCIALLFCPVGVFAQKLCGEEILKKALAAQNPGFAQQLEEQRAALQGIANAYEQQMKMQAAERTTSSAFPIPVVFHFILDSSQFNEIGGIAGITERVDSQIVVLNRDFNRENSDSVLILAGFKPRYASVGIRFGLAHTAPTGAATPGYELRIISTNGFAGSGNAYMDAKDTTSNNGPNSGGLNSWDVTKYLNIWCINFTDYNGLLGITVPQFYVSQGGVGMTEANKGICVRYNAVGKRTLNTDSYPSAIDLGRTLTHECGHVFEIWHVWGDDENDAGQCPWDGGADDGIADTPPQSVSTFGNPVLPDFDGCMDSSGVDMQPYGVMCMNYMDYTDDAGMHMFSIDQAAVMGAQVATGGESYSLTQNPGLLVYPGKLAVTQVSNENSFIVYPNPATGIVNIVFNQSKNDLQQVSVANILGQDVKIVNAVSQDNISIDLSGMSKGIYFIKCNFASGIITKKVLLQ
jgi:hypothetical protein